MSDDEQYFEVSLEHLEKMGFIPSMEEIKANQPRHMKELFEFRKVLAESIEGHDDEAMLLALYDGMLLEANATWSS